MSPSGCENLLVIMQPESFGGFTFNLGPLLQALLWSLILRMSMAPLLVLEVCDVKTAFIKPHCMNVLVGSSFTLDITFEV